MFVWFDVGWIVRDVELAGLVWFDVGWAMRDMDRQDYEMVGWVWFDSEDIQTVMD